MPAFEADRRAAKQKKKEARADQGFSTYSDAQYRSDLLDPSRSMYCTARSTFRGFR